MDRAVANLVDWTAATVEQAFASASLVPARTIGADQRGRIELGRRADLVVLDQALRVEITMIGGEVVFRSKGT
jgi:N-acetylglucosamine-6-phosphate deacetylase